VDDGGTAHERQDRKLQQRKHWDAVAAGWAAHGDWIERNFAPLTQWLRAAGCWRAGSRVLDAACGSGYPTIAAAAAIGRTGRVVATDISPEMLAAASRRAGEAGFDNIDFIEADAEELGLESASVDAATNTYGLMFCPDPQRAVGEMRRVLRRGSCAAIAVWDEPRHNPFFGLMFTAAAPLLNLTRPEAGSPGPFRLASAGELTALLDSAGFVEVAVERIPMTFECASIGHYIEVFGDLALKVRIARLAESDRARLHDAVAEAAAPYVDSGGRLRLQTVSLCASARS
jgi:SAM-dependent methyltransferase